MSGNLTRFDVRRQGFGYVVTRTIGNGKPVTVSPVLPDMLSAIAACRRQADRRAEDKGGQCFELKSGASDDA